jgi:hypothetical protein
MALDRREAVAALLENRGELLVVSGLGSPTYDVHAAGDSDANFYLWGAMGGASLVGLGLASSGWASAGSRRSRLHGPKTSRSS